MKNEAKATRTRTVAGVVFTQDLARTLDGQILAGGFGMWQAEGFTVQRSDDGWCVGRNQPFRGSLDFPGGLHIVLVGSLKAAARAIMAAR